MNFNSRSENRIYVTVREVYQRFLDKQYLYAKSRKNIRKSSVLYLCIHWLEYHYRPTPMIDMSLTFRKDYMKTTLYSFTGFRMHWSSFPLICNTLRFRKAIAIPFKTLDKKISISSLLNYHFYFLCSLLFNLHFKQYIYKAAVYLVSFHVIKTEQSMVNSICDWR